MRFRRIFWAVDAHTEGNPERVVLSGFPPIPGKTMLEKAIYVRKNWDNLRTLLVHEPRGHDNMYASILTEPTIKEASFGVIYLEPGGYATMCGHGTIAICTVLVEMGVVEAREPETEVVLDTAAGLVRTRVAVRDGVAESVTIENVPSFLYRSDVAVDVPDVGHVKVDIAYGGNFYAILRAESVGLKIEPEFAKEIIICGTKIWKAVNEQVEIRHPEIPEIDCVNYVEFSAPAAKKEVAMRNAVVVPPAAIDRSPCGTGTSAKMAVLYTRGELQLNEEFVHESIIKGLFYGKVIGETMVGSYPAVVTTIRGSAYIMAMHQLVLDPRDPFPEGLYLGRKERLYGFEFKS